MRRHHGRGFLNAAVADPVAGARQHRTSTLVGARALHWKRNGRRFAPAAGLRLGFAAPLGEPQLSKALSRRQFAISAATWTTCSAPIPTPALRRLPHNSTAASLVIVSRATMRRSASSPTFVSTKPVNLTTCDPASTAIPVTKKSVARAVQWSACRPPFAADRAQDERGAGRGWRGDDGQVVVQVEALRCRKTPRNLRGRPARQLCKADLGRAPSQNVTCATSDLMRSGLPSIQRRVSSGASSGGAIRQWPTTISKQVSPWRFSCTSPQ